ncbi:hypothetical protein PCE1_000980 [Barthelona sp. PCE]
MSDLALPFLYVGLSSEMMAVLQQRMHAQKINPQKSQRVFRELMTSMFADEVLEPFYAPQDLFDLKSMAAVFTRAAHTSIMKLSANSMHRLFELMTMGFKTKLLQMPSSFFFFELIENYISFMQSLVAHGNTMELLNIFMNRLRGTYNKLHIMDKHNIYQTLLNAFQSNNVRVSILLQEHLQYDNGVCKFLAQRDVPETSYKDIRVLDPNALKIFNVHTDFNYSYGLENVYMKNAKSNAKLTPSGAIQQAKLASPEKPAVVQRVKPKKTPVKSVTGQQEVDGMLSQLVMDSSVDFNIDFDALIMDESITKYEDSDEDEEVVVQAVKAKHTKSNRFNMDDFDFSDDEGGETNLLDLL